MLIQSFLTYIRCELSLSVHTVLSYSVDLRQFREFITGVPQPKPPLPALDDSFDPLTVTTSDIRQWLLTLAESGVSPRTLRRKLTAVSSFYAYLQRKGMLDINPARDVEMAKVPKPLPVNLRSAEVNDIIEQDRPREENPDSFTAIRDSLIFLMLYSTGMRRAELIGLADSAVDTSRGELKVVGKRNKERIIPFGSELREAVESYRPGQGRCHGRADRELLRQARRLTSLSDAGGEGGQESPPGAGPRKPSQSPRPAPLLRFRHAQQRRRPGGRPTAAGA